LDKTRREILQQFAALAVVPAIATPAFSAVPALAQSRPLSSAPASANGYQRSRPYAPLPIKHAPADLFAARLVVPVSKANIRGGFGTSGPLAYKPLGYPGMANMGGTGERDELGLVTGSVADWLCGGAPNDMLVWAESHASLPVHFTLDRSIVDVLKNPGATAFGFGSPHFQWGGTPYSPDTAHYPACNYVPFLATEDQYYLEELQFAATFHLLNANPGYRTPKGLMRDDQTRHLAWGLRDVAACYLATPETVSKPLLPKSYWKQILDNNRDAILANWIHKPHATSGLHMLPIIGGNGPNTIAPWQQDMLGTVFGWMIWTGQFPDWKPIYDWCIRQAIDRTSGKSGYPRSQAILYWPSVAGATDMASFAKVNGLVETADGNYPKTDQSYAAYLRGNLRIAVLNGVPDAAASFAYADRQSKWIPSKWAF
jgi:hypothetical protein